MDLIVLFIVSLFANLLSSLAGGGAGLVQLPILLFLGQPFAQALATHKVATIFLGLGATSKHLKSGLLQAKLCWQLALCGLLGVIPGALFITFVPERLATLALGLLTLGLAIYSMSQKDLGLESRSIAPRRKHMAFLGLGMLWFIALLNGSLSSGTGLMVTLWLVRFYGLSYKQAIAHTLVMVGLLWNGLGGLTLGLAGNINWQWLPILVVASFMGGWLGAKLGHRASNKLLKRLFELVTLATALGLLFSL